MNNRFFKPIMLAFTAAVALIVVLTNLGDPTQTGNIFITIIAGVSWMFVFLYAFGGSKWWKTAAGKSILLDQVAIALITGQVTASIWFKDYPGRDIIRPLTYIVVLLAIVNLLVTLLQTRRRLPRRIHSLDVSPK